MTQQPATRFDSDRLAEIMESALAVDAHERDEFLAAQCGGDCALVAEVKSLLASHSRARPWLSPAEAPSAGESLGPGARVGSYEIVERLGQGGFGDVYRARQLEPVQRDVAIKIIKSGMDTKQVIARFEAERQALAVMNHPAIASVFEAGMTSTGRPYFVMELVNGESLTAHCDRERLSIRERLGIFRQICLAVQHAHSKGIIHRDLKPSNVLVTTVDGQRVPKVIDFGIAKAATTPFTTRTLLTGHWQLIGTPEYMSPEQADLANADIDTRSDIYSLGVLLYELLTGTTPHDRDRLKTKTWSELQRIIREEEPAKPSSMVRTVVAAQPEVAARRRNDPARLSRTLKGELDWIVAKALAKEPSRRYATASGLADDVQRYLNHQPVTASPPGTAYHVRKFIRRHRAAVALAGLVNLALVFAIGTLLVATRRVDSERDDAVTAQLQAEEARFDSDAALSFIVQMLAAGDPSVFGRDVTVREMLDDVSRDLNVVFAGNSKVRTRILLTLGTTYLGIGELETAETHLREALESSRAVSGDSDPQTLDARTQLGIVLRRQARYEEAQSELESAFHLAREALGGRNATTLRAQAALGSLRYYQGRNAEAETHLTNALASAIAIVGGASLETLSIMENLAEVHAALGRTDEALALNVEVGEVLNRHLGAEHPKTLLAQAKLAQRYISTHRYGEAEELLAQVSATCDRVLGAGHPQSLEAASKLGSASMGLSKLDVAEALFQRVVDGRVAMLGEHHPETMAALNNLASVHMARGDFNGAEPLFLRAIAAIEAIDGPEHQRTLIAKYNLARLYMNTSRYEEAERLFAQVVQSAGRVPGPGPDFLPAALNHHGRCLVGLERFAEAEPQLLRAYELFQAARGADHEYTQGAMRSLVALYQRWQRAETAAEWQSRLNGPGAGPIQDAGADDSKSR